MISFIEKKRPTIGYRLLSAFIAYTFVFSVIVPPTPLRAQTLPQGLLNLPLPGTMVTLTPGFNPPLVKGITIHPENPLEFDFLVSSGDDDLEGATFHQEAKKLIKYFLAGLTVPEDKLWVNLSPYEQNRIIPDAFGQTEMGRDMLAQDYILKQLSASLMYPENELGKKFWDRVYTKAYEQYGTTEIPLNTFNKIWIIPEKAVVYEHEQTAFVVESHLKVMLEEDYLALEQNFGKTEFGLNQVVQDDAEVISGVTSEIVKEILIPEIEKEVNEGEMFSQLRQIYNSIILATWYKDNLRQSLLGQIYVNQGKTKGVHVDDVAVNQKIYDQYVEAFKKGVYNYIREDYDPATQQTIPRKYFSGGIGMSHFNLSGINEYVTEVTPRQMAYAASPVERVHTALVSHNATNVDFEQNLAASPVSSITELLTPSLISFIQENGSDLPNANLTAQFPEYDVRHISPSSGDWQHAYTQITTDDKVYDTQIGDWIEFSDVERAKEETPEDSLDLYQITFAKADQQGETSVFVIDRADVQTVFVAEDEDNIRTLDVFLLERAGYQVRGFENGNDLLRAIEEGNIPNLIVTDNQMPELTGRQLVAHKKIIETGIPVLMLTADLEPKPDLDPFGLQGENPHFLGALSKIGFEKTLIPIIKNSIGAPRISSPIDLGSFQQLLRSGNIDFLSEQHTRSTVNLARRLRDEGFEVRGINRVRSRLVIPGILRQSGAQLKLEGETGTPITHDPSLSNRVTNETVLFELVDFGMDPDRGPQTVFVLFNLNKTASSSVTPTMIKASPQYAFQHLLKEEGSDFINGDMDPVVLREKLRKKGFGENVMVYKFINPVAISAQLGNMIPAATNNLIGETAERVAADPRTKYYIQNGARMFQIDNLGGVSVGSTNVFFNLKGLGSSPVSAHLKELIAHQMDGFVPTPSPIPGLVDPEVIQRLFGLHQVASVVPFRPGMSKANIAVLITDQAYDIDTKTWVTADELRNLTFERNADLYQVHFEASEESGPAYVLDRNRASSPIDDLDRLSQLNQTIARLRQSEGGNPRVVERYQNEFTSLMLQNPRLLALMTGIQEWTIISEEFIDAIREKDDVIVDQTAKTLQTKLNVEGEPFDLIWESYLDVIRGKVIRSELGPMDTSIDFDQAVIDHTLRLAVLSLKGTSSPASDVEDDRERFMTLRQQIARKTIERRMELIPPILSEIEPTIKLLRLYQNEAQKQGRDNGFQIKGTLRRLIQLFPEDKERIMPDKYFDINVQLAEIRDAFETTLMAYEQGSADEAFFNHFYRQLKNDLSALQTRLEEIKTELSSSPVQLIKDAQTISITNQDIKPLKWGTAGARGRLDDLNDFSIDNVSRQAAGFAEETLKRVAQGQYKPINEKTIRVLFAYDAREGADEFALAMGKVVSAYQGFEIDVADSIMPTPMAARLSQRHREGAYDFVFHITASHNQMGWQGIKFLTKGTVNEDRWTHPFQKRANAKTDYPINPNFQPDRIQFTDALIEEYLNDVFPGLVDSFNVYKAENPGRSYTIDLMHGAMVEFSPFFKQLGFNVVRDTPMKDIDFTGQTYQLGNKEVGFAPDPTQSTFYKDRPEYQDFVNNAPDGSIYFLVDGDGDRLVTIPKINDELVSISPNKFGPLAADYVLTNNLFPQVKRILRTFVTTAGMDAVARYHNLGEPIIVPVGSKYFNPYAEDSIALEESGHLVFPGHFDDTVYQLGLILKMMIETDKDLVTLMEEQQTKVGYKGVDNRDDYENASDAMMAKFTAPFTGAPEEIRAQTQQVVTEVTRRSDKELLEALVVVVGSEGFGEVVPLTKYVDSLFTDNPLQIEGSNRGLIIRFDDLSWGGARLSGTANTGRLYTEGRETEEERQKITDAFIDTLNLKEGDGSSPVVSSIANKLMQINRSQTKLDQARQQITEIDKLETSEPVNEAERRQYAKRQQNKEALITEAETLVGVIHMHMGELTNLLQTFKEESRKNGSKAARIIQEQTEVPSFIDQIISRQRRRRQLTFNQFDSATGTPVAVTDGIKTELYNLLTVFEQTSENLRTRQKARQRREGSSPVETKISEIIPSVTLQLAKTGIGREVHVVVKLGDQTTIGVLEVTERPFDFPATRDMIIELFVKLKAVGDFDFLSYRDLETIDTYLVEQGAEINKKRGKPVKLKHIVIPISTALWEMAANLHNQTLQEFVLTHELKGPLTDQKIQDIAASAPTVDREQIVEDVRSGLIVLMNQSKLDEPNFAGISKDLEPYYDELERVMALSLEEKITHLKEILDVVRVKLRKYKAGSHHSVIQIDGMIEQMNQLSSAPGSGSASPISQKVQTHLLAVQMGLVNLLRDVEGILSDFEQLDEKDFRERLKQSQEMLEAINKKLKLPKELGHIATTFKAIQESVEIVSLITPQADRGFEAFREFHQAVNRSANMLTHSIKSVLEQAGFRVLPLTIGFISPSQVTMTTEIKRTLRDLQVGLAILEQQIDVAQSQYNQSKNIHRFRSDLSKGVTAMVNGRKTITLPPELDGINMILDTIARQMTAVIRHDEAELDVNNFARHIREHITKLQGVLETIEKGGSSSPIVEAEAEVPNQNLSIKVLKEVGPAAESKKTVATITFVRLPDREALHLSTMLNLPLSGDPSIYAQTIAEELSTKINLKENPRDYYNLPKMVHAMFPSASTPVINDLEQMALALKGVSDQISKLTRKTEEDEGRIKDFLSNAADQLKAAHENVEPTSQLQLAGILQKIEALEKTVQDAHTNFPDSVPEFLGALSMDVDILIGNTQSLNALLTIQYDLIGLLSFMTMVASHYHVLTDAQVGRFLNEIHEFAEQLIEKTHGNLDALNQDSQETIGAKLNIIEQDIDIASKTVISNPTAWNNFHTKLGKDAHALSLQIEKMKASFAAASPVQSDLAAIKDMLERSIKPALDKLVADITVVSDIDLWSTDIKQLSQEQKDAVIAMFTDSQWEAKIQLAKEDETINGLENLISEGVVKELGSEQPALVNHLIQYFVTYEDVEQAVKEALTNYKKKPVSDRETIARKAIFGAWAILKTSRDWRERNDIQLPPEFDVEAFNAIEHRLELHAQEGELPKSIPTFVTNLKTEIDTIIANIETIESSMTDTPKEAAATKQINEQTQRQLESLQDVLSNVKHTMDKPLSKKYGQEEQLIRRGVRIRESLWFVDNFNPDELPDDIRMKFYGLQRYLQIRTRTLQTGEEYEVSKRRVGRIMAILNNHIDEVLNTERDTPSPTFYSEAFTGTEYEGKSEEFSEILGADQLAILKDQVWVVRGPGNVGSRTTALLLWAGAKVIATESYQQTIDNVTKQFQWFIDNDRLHIIKEEETEPGSDIFTRRYANVFEYMPAERREAMDIEHIDGIAATAQGPSLILEDLDHYREYQKLGLKYFIPIENDPWDRDHPKIVEEMRHLGIHVLNDFVPNQGGVTAAVEGTIKSVHVSYKSLADHVIKQVADYYQQALAEDRSFDEVAIERANEIIKTSWDTVEKISTLSEAHEDIDELREENDIDPFDVVPLNVLLENQERVLHNPKILDGIEVEVLDGTLFINGQEVEEGTLLIEQVYRTIDPEFRVPLEKSRNFKRRVEVLAYKEDFSELPVEVREAFHNQYAVIKHVDETTGRFHILGVDTLAKIESDIEALHGRYGSIGGTKYGITKDPHKMLRLGLTLPEIMGWKNATGDFMFGGNKMVEDASDDIDPNHRSRTNNQDQWDIRAHDLIEAAIMHSVVQTLTGAMIFLAEDQNVSEKDNNLRGKFALTLPTTVNDFGYEGKEPAPYTAFVGIAALISLANTVEKAAASPATDNEQLIDEQLNEWLSDTRDEIQNALSLMDNNNTSQARDVLRLAASRVKTAHDIIHQLDQVQGKLEQLQTIQSGLFLASQQLDAELPSPSAIDETYQHLGTASDQVDRLLGIVPRSEGGTLSSPISKVSLDTSAVDSVTPEEALQEVLKYNNKKNARQAYRRNDTLVDIVVSRLKENPKAFIPLNAALRVGELVKKDPLRYTLVELQGVHKAITDVRTEAEERVGLRIQVEYNRETLRATKSAVRNIKRAITQQSSSSSPVPVAPETLHDFRQRTLSTRDKLDEALGHYDHGDKISLHAAVAEAVELFSGNMDDIELLEGKDYSGIRTIIENTSATLNEAAVDSGENFEQFHFNLSLSLRRLRLHLEHKQKQSASPITYAALTYTEALETAEEMNIQKPLESLKDDLAVFVIVRELNNNRQAILPFNVSLRVAELVEEDPLLFSALELQLIVQDLYEEFGNIENDIELNADTDNLYTLRVLTISAADRIMRAIPNAAASPVTGKKKTQPRPEVWIKALRTRTQVLSHFPQLNEEVDDITARLDEAFQNIYKTDDYSAILKTLEGLDHRITALIPTFWSTVILSDLKPTTNIKDHITPQLQMAVKHSLFAGMMGPEREHYVSHQKQTLFVLGNVIMEGWVREDGNVFEVRWSHLSDITRRYVISLETEPNGDIKRLDVWGNREYLAVAFEKTDSPFITELANILDLPEVTDEMRERILKRVEEETIQLRSNFLETDIFAKKEQGPFTSSPVTTMTITREQILKTPHLLFDLIETSRTNAFAITGPIRLHIPNSGQTRSASISPSRSARDIIGLIDVELGKALDNRTVAQTYQVTIGTGHPDHLKKKYSGNDLIFEVASSSVSITHEEVTTTDKLHQIVDAALKHTKKSGIKAVITVQTPTGGFFTISQHNTRETILSRIQEILLSSFLNDRRAYNVTQAGSKITFDYASSPIATKGGIDLNPALMNLEIKRDGNGIPLPMNLQPVEVMNIEGLLPIIINITPIVNVPLLLGFADTESESEYPTYKSRLEPADKQEFYKGRELDELSYLN